MVLTSQISIDSMKKKDHLHGSIAILILKIPYFAINKPKNLKTYFKLWHLNETKTFYIHTFENAMQKGYIRI